MPSSAPRYHVYSALAGNSAARRYRRSFVSRAAAVRYARTLDGFGIYGIVTAA